MSEFETYSILISVCQLGLIAWGIGIMRGSNKTRDVLVQSLERQMASLDRQGSALEKMGRGIERLLERSQ